MTKVGQGVLVRAHYPIVYYDAFRLEQFKYRYCSGAFYFCPDLITPCTAHRIFIKCFTAFLLEL